MMWLRQQGVALPVRLMPAKIRDQGRTVDEFVPRLPDRLGELGGMPGMREDFVREMWRFLPADIVRETVENPSFWWPRRFRLRKASLPRCTATGPMPGSGWRDPGAPAGLRHSGVGLLPFDMAGQFPRQGVGGQGTEGGPKGCPENDDFRRRPGRDAGADQVVEGMRDSLHASFAAGNGNHCSVPIGHFIAF